MATFEFSQEEMSELIYAAREAQIRFKRARTLYREGHESYSQWDEDTLNHSVAKFANLELSLCERYQVAFGEAW